jgi:hypothetical protein
MSIRKLVPTVWTVLQPWSPMEHPALPRASSPTTSFRCCSIFLSLVVSPPSAVRVESPQTGANAALTNCGARAQPVPKTDEIDVERTLADDTCTHTYRWARMDRQSQGHRPDMAIKSLSLILHLLFPTHRRHPMLQVRALLGWDSHTCQTQRTGIKHQNYTHGKTGRLQRLS